MQQVAQIAGSLSLSESRESTPKEQQRSNASLTRAQHLMTKLWPLMAKSFGHKWVSQYGDHDEGDVWAKWLDGITAEQMAEGMARLRDQNPTWPPGAGDFRKLCLNEHEKVNRGIGAGAYGKPFKALPKPPPTEAERALALEQVANMRAML